MANELQITYLKGKIKIATQFVRELSSLTGPLCRAYGGRKKLDADAHFWGGQLATYKHLLRLAQAGKF